MSLCGSSAAPLGSRAWAFLAAAKRGCIQLKSAQAESPAVGYHVVD